MTLLERVCSHGETHGAEEAAIEAELRKEVEGYGSHIGQKRVLRFRNSLMTSIQNKTWTLRSFCGKGVVQADSQVSETMPPTQGQKWSIFLTQRPRSLE